VSLAPKLSAAINATWGSVESFIAAFNAQATALQGSGWVWLVKDAAGKLAITITQVFFINCPFNNRIKILF